MQRRQVLVAALAAAQTTRSLARDASGTPPPGAAAVVVPGPRNSVSLPLELAVRQRFDREKGLPMRLAFVGGGGVAIQELRAGNAEFAVFGLPAMVRANRLGGAPLVALAAVDDLPLYTLVVRADLRGSIRRIADLAGRTLGVHSNSLQSRTTSHQLADYLLKRAGVDPRTVKVLAAGQSWETQAAMLRSRSVDASMSDEPFATRMEVEGLAFKLFSTGDPADAAAVPGTGFLRAVLVARRDAVDRAPGRAEAAVRTLQRTLGWIAHQTPEAFADGLGLTGPERDAMLLAARRFPRQYSPDGRFSDRQIAETETFFRFGNDDLPDVERLRIDDMLDTRWAGRRA